MQYFLTSKKYFISNSFFASSHAYNIQETGNTYNTSFVNKND